MKLQVKLGIFGLLLGAISCKEHDDNQYAICILNPAPGSQVRGVVKFKQHDNNPVQV